MAGDVRANLAGSRAALDTKRSALIDRHRAERELLRRKQAARWLNESEIRKARFKIGLKGLWQRISGKRAQITNENQQSAYVALKRDEAQKQAISAAQLGERRSLEMKRSALRREAMSLVQEMRQDRDAILQKLTEPQKNSRKRRAKPTLDQHIKAGPDFEL